MFYYGLDFHDLTPDSLLHISSFIVVCEAFLRITPHFGLWLKTFDVKPKMVEGQHAACGSALISKIAGAPRPKGSFPEVSGLWQREWFYITAPRSAKWVASPAFRSGPLRESWIRGCPDSRTIPSAGPLDYEDTRLKTLSHVRKGLSLAWKASLEIRICRSPTIVTDSV